MRTYSQKWDPYVSLHTHRKFSTANFLSKEHRELRDASQRNRHSLILLEIWIWTYRVVGISLTLSLSIAMSVAVASAALPAITHAILPHVLSAAAPVGVALPHALAAAPIRVALSLSLSLTALPHHFSSAHTSAVSALLSIGHHAVGVAHAALVSAWTSACGKLSCLRWWQSILSECKFDIT